MGKKKKEVKETKKKSQNAAGSTQFENKSARISSFIEKKGLVALFLFLLSFGVFAFSLKGDFVWDDAVLIKNSTTLKASYIDYKTLIPWQGKSHKGKHYRPLMRISWVADQEIWGGSPVGFHLSNVIFHSASTALFYFMALLILGEFKVERKESIAFLSSLFFALIPIHVESVSFIAARADLLCSMFFFLAFIFNILSYRKLWFFALAILCFYLSLLSKEVAVAFPLVAIGFDLISGRFRSRSSLLRYAFFGLLIFIYLYFRRGTLEFLSRFASEHLWWMLRVFFDSYVFYLGKLIFPFKLNPFITSEPVSVYYFIFSVLVIILLCIVGYISIRKKERVTAFSIYWVFATLGPNSLVAMFGYALTPFAERFLYIPSAGFCIFIGYFLLEVTRRLKVEKLGWALGLLLCVIYLLFTISGQGVWKNDLSLWERASKRTPNNAVPHINYGNSLLKEGKTDDGIRELSYAFMPGVVSGRRQRVYAADNLGILYLDKKEYELAEGWFNKALSYNPRFYKAYYNLGLIYIIKGKKENDASYYRKAESYLKRATRLKRRFGRAHLALADLYLELGHRENARKEAKKALQSGLREPLAKEARKILSVTEN